MNNRGYTLVKVLVLMTVLGVLFAVLFLPICFGLYLAFKASILLGFIAAIVEPSPLVLTVLYICGQHDVATKIAAWLHLPF